MHRIKFEGPTSICSKKIVHEELRRENKKGNKKRSKVMFFKNIYINANASVIAVLISCTTFILGFVSVSQ